MNVTLRLPQMTREQFLDWVERQEEPFEFDGYAVVAMTRGNRHHAEICSNLIFALRSRLVGTDCSVLSEAGIATVGDAVRYPDVLLTRTSGPGTDRLMPDPLIVFEVISPSSGRIDRHVKLREYAQVPSILCYVIVDNLGPDLAVFSRAAGQAWVATSLTAGDTLALPVAGIDLPVDEVFLGIEFEA